MSGAKGIDRGPVVVTGTSTGIGAATAVLLADQGFRVFAGVRDRVDAEALAARTTGELRPLVIDITDQASIKAAAKEVTEAVGERGLAGLVNNAGAVWPGPLEFQPIDEFRAQLEVNLVGHLAVIQTFLPLIRRGHGRIVNVGSIGGKLVLPIHGAYSASKFGMEALSDALRLELRQWRIPVSLIEPGATDTAIFGKTLTRLDEAAASLRARGEHRYDAQFAAMRRVVEKTAAEHGTGRGASPDHRRGAHQLEAEGSLRGGQGRPRGGGAGAHAIGPRQGPGHRQGRETARTGIGRVGPEGRPGSSRGSSPRSLSRSRVGAPVERRRQPSGSHRIGVKRSAVVGAMPAFDGRTEGIDTLPDSVAAT